MSDLAVIEPDQSSNRAAAAYSLDEILRLLDILSVRIARYTILHTTPNRPPSAESAGDDEALAWMLTSLEDIAATLIGISTCPREAD